MKPNHLHAANSINMTLVIRELSPIEFSPSKRCKIEINEKDFTEGKLENTSLYQDKLEIPKSENGLLVLKVTLDNNHNVATITDLAIKAKRVNLENQVYDGDKSLENFGSKNISHQSDFLLDVAKTENEIEETLQFPAPISLVKTSGCNYIHQENVTRKVRVNVK